MTKLLEKAIEAVRELSPDEQDTVARAMLGLASTEFDEVPEDIDPKDLASVLEGLADAKAGRIASAEEVEAAYRRSEN